jgi:hypothetical protein
MTTQDALTLEQGDICLFNNQYFRVAQVLHSGNLIHLRGKTQDQMVSPKRLVLVYRKADAPKDVQLGWLTAEQEASALGIAAEREAKAREAREARKGQG